MVAYVLSELNFVKFRAKFCGIVIISPKDGMVEILQKCLQQYSGVSILRARKIEEEDETSSTEASKLFDKLLEIDTDSWDDEIRNGLASSDDMTTQKLTNEIQKTMVRTNARITDSKRRISSLPSKSLTFFFFVLQRCA